MNGPCFWSLRVTEGTDIIGEKNPLNLTDKILSNTYFLPPFSPLYDFEGFSLQGTLQVWKKVDVLMDSF